MILARLYFEVPADFWRPWFLCIDGVSPFVSHCLAYLVPWSWHGGVPAAAWQVTP